MPFGEILSFLIQYRFSLPSLILATQGWGWCVWKHVGIYLLWGRGQGGGGQRILLHLVVGWLSNRLQ